MHWLADKLIGWVWEGFKALERFNTSVHQSWGPKT